MRLILGIFLGVVLFLSACQSEQQKKTTPMGYEFEIHSSKGEAKAKPKEFVRFSLQVMAEDSVLYDSRDQPQVPILSIPGEGETSKSPIPLEDVLVEMGIGDSATLYIPMDSLPQKPPGFEEVAALEYKIVAQEILSPEEYEAEQAEERAKQQALMEAGKIREAEVKTFVDEMLAKYNGNSLGDELQSTASGLKYVMHEQGTGDNPTNGSNVDVHYYGTLLDGTMFDNSFARGQPISFRLGQGMVIQGWDEGIALMKPGSSATFFIPYELAYGEAGRPPSIPPKSELVFYVELQ